jgi:1-acyl-sn-glycerol-3-phosphate acyltransferase
LFDGDWLNAGDYAYLADGEVFITGRAKDVIIRAGRNIHPYELEQAVGELPGIRQGAVAVFATTDPSAVRERLIVLAETRLRDEDKLTALRDAIDGLATELTGNQPDDVVLAPPRSVLKTSSGKIRRAACRAAYDKGQFTAAARRGAWFAGMRRLAAAAPLLQRGTRLLRDYAYAGYAWLAFLTLGTAANLLLLTIPSTNGAYRVAHFGCRLVARLVGIPVHIRGLENLQQAGICVVAANHASYIDALALIAASPRPLHFVAKAELRRYLPIRLALERLGTEFVKRSDAQHGVQVTEKLTERVRRSSTVVYFPEATFTRAVGLLPFRMGAFVTAARTRVPVIPIAIRGSRSILRGSSWFPRRGELDVTIGATVHPRDDSWESAVKLRAEVRAFILKHCGEPDLADHASIALAGN